MDHLVGPSAPAAPAIARPADHPPARSGASACCCSISARRTRPTIWSMRRYLKEFLSDRRVIETSRLIWWPVLNLIILTKRPGPKGQDYAKIWNKERDEGPLKTITSAQAEQPRAASERFRGRSRRGRLGDALRQSRRRRPHPGAAPRGLRPHPAGAALSAIFGRDLGDGLRPRLPGADGHALAAGDAGLAALSRRSGLHRRGRHRR